MNAPVLPWLFTIMLGIYLFGLNYYSSHRTPPGPAYRFYDTTAVHVHISGQAGPHTVFCQHNSILQEQRIFTKARVVTDSTAELVFRINSPRPALLYLNDELIEIFLRPGDTSLHVFADLKEGVLDSVGFLGGTEQECRYYRERLEEFGESDLRRNYTTLRGSSSLAYSAKLDSLAAQELAFLAKQEIFESLPQWFVDLEKSEILYQIAYLKLNRGPDSTQTDKQTQQLALYNHRALFSYYYYMYLKACFQDKILKGDSVLSGSKQAQMMQLADQQLEGSAKDVFMTRTILECLSIGNLLQAEALLSSHQQDFASKRYLRFLQERVRIEKRKAKNLQESPMK
ncbi:hypothetical protein [Pontibacter sp. G13]|uniref:hypothetical protein n=1 Tax=Pontibacter sp. G13 TaxID=3074898 RepID=UPI00288BEB35|nr:hypothetical protein [Pontibacter sp. G13]WNJ15993.1 hypothetical protein RJD25_14110 [Pontibacter sp. G13]